METVSIMWLHCLNLTLHAKPHIIISKLMRTSLRNTINLDHLLKLMHVAKEIDSDLTATYVVKLTKEARQLGDVFKCIKERMVLC